MTWSSALEATLAPSAEQRVRGGEMGRPVRVAIASQAIAPQATARGKIAPAGRKARIA
ncbi:MAG: hypothetical protein ABR599_02510 [Gemmatimonadota bacterium]